MSRFSCLFLISVIVLFALGLVMIFNTSSAEVLDRFLDKSTHHALIKQMLYSLVGGVGAMGIWFIGYQNLLKLSGPLLVLGTLLLISVFVPGIGQQINGAHRWINLFGNSLQPSEFVKFLIPLYYIHCVTRAQGPLDLKSLLKLLGKLTVPLGLILIEPDNGTVFIVLVTILMLFILTRMRTLYWAVPLCILCVGGGIVSLRMPHVSDRIHIYLHPESDLKGKGHQPYQAKIATGSGGLFGKGLGESLQKLNTCPRRAVITSLHLCRGMRLCRDVWFDLSLLVDRLCGILDRAARFFYRGILYCSYSDFFDLFSGIFKSRRRLRLIAEQGDESPFFQPRGIFVTR